MSHHEYWLHMTKNWNSKGVDVFLFDHSQHNCICFETDLCFSICYGWKTNRNYACKTLKSVFLFHHFTYLVWGKCNIMFWAATCDHQLTLTHKAMCNCPVHMYPSWKPCLNANHVLPALRPWVTADGFAQFTYIQQFIFSVTPSPTSHSWLKLILTRPEATQLPYKIATIIEFPKHTCLSGFGPKRVNVPLSW